MFCQSGKSCRKREWCPNDNAKHVSQHVRVFGLAVCKALDESRLNQIASGTFAPREIGEDQMMLLGICSDLPFTGNALGQNETDRFRLGVNQIAKPEREAI